MCVCRCFVLFRTTPSPPVTSISGTTMHTSFILLSILITTALAAPSTHHLLPRQNATKGPCDPWSPICQPVRQSNACLAQFLNRANDSVILRCVDDQDAGQAKVDVSERGTRGMGGPGGRLTRIDLCVLWVRFGAGEVGCEDGVVRVDVGWGWGRRRGDKSEARCMFRRVSTVVLLPTCGLYYVRMDEQRFDCRFQASA
jgi:hypothetical protein